jgi:hypothetical protein
MTAQDSKRRVALITGVTGQDGAYLAEYLLGLGYTETAGGLDLWRATVLSRVAKVLLPPPDGSHLATEAERAALLGLAYTPASGDLAEGYGVAALALSASLAVAPKSNAPQFTLPGDGTFRRGKKR